MTITQEPSTPTSQEVAEFIEVTPAIAQRWLGLNTSNRKIKPANVTAFKRDMEEGRWRSNGEAIKLAGSFYKPTKLLDGQNRLHALMKSGQTVRMLVVFGIDPRAQSTMDSGAKRTVADNLSIQGVFHTRIVAAAAALAMRARIGRLGAGSSLFITNAEMQEFISENPALYRSATVASQYAKRSDAPPSVVAYTHFEMSKIDLDDATAFWRDAAEKVGLTANDPAHSIAQRFAQARRGKERVPAAVAIAAVYRAWNYRRAGRPLDHVKFRGNVDGSVTIPRLI